MPHYGTLQDHDFAEDVDDIRGATIYDLENQKVGKLDDVIFDHTTGVIKYAVIDSGGWLRSRKFLVLADRISPYEEDRDGFVVGVTKHQIENLPPYDESKLTSEEEWKRYEKEYEKGWQAAPVQHRHGSDRNITPPEELRAEAGPQPAADRELKPGNLFPERIADKFTSATPSGRKITVRASSRKTSGGCCLRHGAAELPLVGIRRAPTAQPHGYSGQVPAVRASTRKEAGLSAPQARTQPTDREKLPNNSAWLETFLHDVFPVPSL